METVEAHPVTEEVLQVDEVRIKRITVRDRALVIHIPLTPQQLPIHAHVTASGPTGIGTSMYDPDNHSWVVQHYPLHPGAVEITVKLIVLHDPHQQYDVHVAMSKLEEAVPIELLAVLQQRSNVLHQLDVVYRPDWRQTARSFCPVAGCVTLACPLPTWPFYQLCGGGFRSEYPVVATQPVALAEEGGGEDEITTTTAPSALATLPSNAVALLSHKQRQLNTSSEGKAGTEKERLNGWAVVATPTSSLACFAIGIRLKEPSEWGQPASLAKPRIGDSSAMEMSLCSWASKSSLEVQLGGPHTAFRLKIPIPRPQEITIPRDRSTHLTESLDFFYS